MIDQRISRRSVIRGLIVGGGAIAAGSILAACGGGAAPAATSAPAAAAPAASAPTNTPAAAAAAAPVNAPTNTPAAAPAAQAASSAATGAVRWQFRGSDTDLSGAQAFLNDTFGKQFPNIKVSVEPAPDLRDEKLIAAMVGGNAPDVFESWSDNVTQFSDKGQVMDVEALVKTDYTAEDLKDFYPWQWHDFVLPSKVRFGLPKYVNVMFTWYNKDIFDKAGIKPPDETWTHDLYAANANKLTVRNADTVTQWGLFYPVWGWDRYWYKIDAFGGLTRDANDDTLATFDSDKAMQAWEWSRKLMWDDKAMANSLMLAGSGQNFDSLQLFASGKFAMAEDGFYPFAMAKAIQKKINWGYSHTPLGPAQRKVLGTTDGFVLWKNTKTQAASWELLKFLAGKDYQVNQVKVTGLLPIRFSALADWKKICLAAYPELEQVNLDVGPKAMELGYPGNRQFFKKDAEARQIMTPALEKVYISGGTPVSYFKDIAKQVTDKMRA